MIAIALIATVIARLMDRSAVIFDPVEDNAAGTDPPTGHPCHHRRSKGPVW